MNIPPTTPAHTHSTRVRANSLPPLTSDGPLPSDPITGTPRTRKAIIQKKSQVKRAKTLAAKKANKLIEKEAAMIQAQEAERSAAEVVENAKCAVFDGILDTLNARGYTFGQLMAYVFDPIYKQGVHRWNGFFKVPGTATSILWLWASKRNSESARNEVHDWAVDYVRRCVRREAHGITQSGIFQSHKRPINTEYFLDFDMRKIYHQLRSVATVAMDIFEAFSTSARHIRDGCSPVRQAKREMVVGSMGLQGLSQYSQGNNYGRKVFSIFFYATGAQRQAISVASHVGLSESYASIVQKARRRPASTDNLQDMPVTQIWKPGTLRALSDSVRTVARGVASTGLFGVVYDNINMMFRVSEQVMGRNGVFYCIV
ncbi:hypothetical protein BV22DRAFT_1026562 [Leucogyrophana mollusca]|uniref:Uncharacterized protein n=1 Tax=Leucogyrophana mollusca TaxID=85980 RepID=A0ACB8AVS8_9AGAM|nr:hypothetical protein BV22DRAFT_1026562 [Leucogyrophana mollusca]